MVYIIASERCFFHFSAAEHPAKSCQRQSFHDFAEMVPAAAIETQKQCSYITTINNNRFRFIRNIKVSFYG
jgi:hypothetical protein